MMALMLLFVASCKQNKNDDPNKPAPVDPDATKVSIVADYSAIMYEPNNPQGCDFYAYTLCFATEGADIVGGYYDGTGDIIDVTILASNADETTYLPQAGEYTIADKLAPGNFAATITTIENGKNVDELEIENGKIVISGNGSNCTISLELGDKKYAYSGAFEINNLTPYGDEPKTAKNITLSSNDAVLYYWNSYGQVQIQGASSDNLFCSIVYYYSEDMTGTFGTMKSQNDDGILPSSGLDLEKMSYSPSLVAEIDAEGRLAGGIYFIVDGSITVSGGDGTFSATGALTSFYGSTITLNLSGETIDVEAQQEEIAPRHIARRR